MVFDCVYRRSLNENYSIRFRRYREYIFGRPLECTRFSGGTCWLDWIGSQIVKPDGT